MKYQHQFTPGVANHLSVNEVRSGHEPGLEEIERLKPKVLEMIVDTHNNLTQAIVGKPGYHYSYPHSPPRMLSTKNYILHETLGCVVPTDASCEKVFQHRFA